MTSRRPNLSCLQRWLVCGLLLLCGLLMLRLAQAAEDFLPPEQAFQVSARMATPDRVEVLVRIAPNYYLYREPLNFSAQGASVGSAEVPAGTVKYDENFGKNVETYRGELRMGLPVSQLAGPFTLRIVTQGCADAGLCYPPMTTALKLDPSQTGAMPVSAAAAAAPGRAGGEAGGSWLDSGRIGQVLQDGRLLPVIGVFLGLGLLLSLTPCVLPMLPILSSLIVGAQDEGGGGSRLRGLALAGSYSLGMALVYTALGVAAGLAGEGLGAALQTPAVLFAFAAMLVLLSLAMFDVYDLRLPSGLTTRLSEQCNRQRAGRLLGVFMMGGVSALIVSPCVSAPLAGALLFISQSRDVVLGGAALFALSVGMSVPLLLLGASAGRWLPRAGVWMQGIKRLFGVLMLAVALWVAQPVLPVALSMAGWGLLLLLAGFMLRPFSGQPMHRHALRDGLSRALGLAALVWGAMLMVAAGSGGRDPLKPLAHLVAADAAQAGQGAANFRVVRSSAEFDEALRSAAGRPLMLDFYADWCVSCKEMERFTFSDPEIAARLQAAVLIKADVTANTEDQRALLRRFQLFGPPGTLFFDARSQEIAQARVIGFQDARRFARTLGQAGL